MKCKRCGYEDERIGFWYIWFCGVVFGYAIASIVNLLIIIK